MNPKTLLLILSSCSISVLHAASCHSSSSAASKLTSSDESAQTELSCPRVYDDSSPVHDETTLLLAINGADEEEDPPEAGSRRESTSGAYGALKKLFGTPVFRNPFEISDQEIEAKYNPDNVIVESLANLPLLLDGYAGLSGERKEKVRQEQTAILKDPRKRFSFEWIYHLAHSGEIADVYTAGQAEEVKRTFEKGLDDMRLYSLRYPAQKAHTEELYEQALTGRRKPEYAKISRSLMIKELIYNYRKHKAYATGYHELMQKILSVEFILKKMQEYEEAHK